MISRSTLPFGAQRDATSPRGLGSAPVGSPAAPRRGRALGALPALLAWVVLLTLSACAAETGPDGSAAVGRAAKESDAASAPWEGTADCGPPLTAALAPSADVTDATGVARYDVALDDGRMRVALTSSDGTALGSYETWAELDLVPGTTVLGESRAIVRLVEGGEETGRQVFSTRPLSEGRLLIGVKHAHAGREVDVWTIVDGDRRVLRQVVTTAAQGASDGPVTRLPDGTVLDTLVVVAPEQPAADAAAIRAWLDARLGEHFRASASWRLLEAVANDVALEEGTDAHIVLCRALSIDAAEAAHFAGADKSAGCGASPGQKRCGPTDRQFVTAYQGILTVDAALGVFAGALAVGTAVTTVAVGAGITLAAGHIALIAVGSYVFVYLLNDAAERALEQNRSTVVRTAVGGIGRVFTSGAAADAAADFFTDDGSPRRSGGSAGDPHIDTLDGLSYSFQSAGEFVLIEAVAGPPFVVQTRQVPADGICVGVAVNAAVATVAGDQRVVFSRDADAPVRIDGEPVALDGGLLALGGGAILERGAGLREEYELSWPSGERLRVRVEPGVLVDAAVALPEGRRSQVRGLLGDFDGTPDNDLTRRDGDALREPVEWSVLVGEFADAWRVGPRESLFSYGPGESTQTFTDRSFPAAPTRVADLPDGVREAAERACAEAGVRNPIALEQCVLDRGCSGSDALVASHEGRAPGRAAAVDTGAFGPDPCAVRANEAVDNPYTCPALCVARGFAVVIGTDVYDDASMICATAVHAGVIADATGGRVELIGGEGRESYTGSVRNGVASRSGDGSLFSVTVRRQ